MPRITKTLVDQLAPREREYEVRDSEVPGFGVRVRISGQKSYVLVYRKGTGRRSTQHRVTLGSAGELTPDQARTKARKLSAEVTLGGHPAAEISAQRTALTVADLMDQFMTKHVAVRLRPATAREYSRLTDRVIKPALGTIAVAEVTPALVSQWHHDGRATPRQSKLALAVLSKALALAEVWGLRPPQSNPCRSIQKYTDRKRDRLLSDAEINRIFAELKRGEQCGDYSPSVVLAIHLLFATGCRTDEVCRLRWEQIDWERSLISWSETKTGAAEKPLTQHVADLLRRAKLVVGNPYVCFAAGTRTHLRHDVLRPNWSRVLQRANINHCGLHAIRHRAATDLYNDPEIALPIAMQAIGHKSAQTALRYAHPTRQQVATAAGKLGKHFKQENGR